MKVSVVPDYCINSTNIVTRGNIREITGINDKINFGYTINVKLIHFDMKAY